MEQNLFSELVGKKFYKFQRTEYNEDTNEVSTTKEIYLSQEAYKNYLETKENNTKSFYKPNEFVFLGEVSAKDYLIDMYQNHISHKEFANKTNMDKELDDIRNLPEAKPLNDLKLDLKLKN